MDYSRILHQNYIQIAYDRLSADPAPDSDLIKFLIKGHEEEAKRMYDLHERYKASAQGVPIMKRRFDDGSKINNKINNDFFSDIVDTKVGYFAGRPISYMHRDKLQEVEDEIALFSRRNNLPDLDSETVKTMAICGMAVRLLYFDLDGNEKAINIYPWEAILIHEDGIEAPIAAMRYYDVERIRDGKWQKIKRVEWYDDTNVTYWIEQSKDGQYLLDGDAGVNPQEHNFDFIPVIGFSNNEELQGDCEKVLALIDGYDRTLSDVNSEIEQFRLAYFATYGVEIDEETLQKAMRTGAFSFPDTDSKMEFVTKSMDGSMVESHLDRLEDNIMRFAKSINLADEQFSGTSSGVALRYKMFGLESKCITAERKMTTALRRMFEVLGSAWNKKDITFDALDIDFQFTRNFPLNLLDEAQTSQTLKGLVSDQTRLSLLTFVEDVDAEMERIEEEYEPLMLEQDEVVEDDEEVETSGQAGGNIPAER